jgi:hypothetical protein
VPPLASVKKKGDVNGSFDGLTSGGRKKAAIAEVASAGRYYDSMKSDLNSYGNEFKT